MKYLALLLLAVAGCGSDDANAAGDYDVVVTNGDNGCNVPNWTVGASASATVTLTQNGNDVTASVTGLAGLALDLALGGHTYSGQIQSSTLDLELFGTRSDTLGNCTYTINSEIHAVLDGDVLAGQIDYLPATNGNPDCSGIMNCRSFQEFTGTRSAQ